MMLLRSSISTIRRSDIETNCEVLWVELSLGTNKVLLGTFYRPPNSSSEQLDLSLAAISESYTVVLCGDFNLPRQVVCFLTMFSLKSGQCYV